MIPPTALPKLPGPSAYHRAMTTQKIRVAIVGASGYSGAELVSILLAHPNAEIVGLFGSGKAEKAGAQPPSFGETFGRFRNVLDQPVAATDPAAIAALKPHVVFLCTPHEASLDLAPQFIERGMVVIDLSAAFRLQRTENYPKFYGFEHSHAALLREAVYGLPELFRERLAKPSTRLIAAPGCYPTSIILPLAALARAGAIAEGSRPIIDATSGVSGAGRKAEQRLLFCEVSQSVYGVFKHRHQPEIDEYVGRATLFTPHLGTYDRGILSTIHVDLAPGWTDARLRETLAAAYAREPFVRLCKPGVWPAVGDVRATNYCDIALAVDESSRPAHAIIVSAIDNLTRGAAGQAVQAMNIRFALEETAGLRR